MLKLKSSSPGTTTLQHLASQQAVIDGLKIEEQVTRAQELWKTKSSVKGGKPAFDEVKQALIDLCVSTELCNYCEHNEATDIEHVYPKSFFPERTFQWPNYLLACKTCNTHYKLDKFAVFAPAKSATAVILQRKKLPPSTDAAFIDPRVDDPLYYLLLDITGKTFHLVPHPTLTNPREIAKAQHTLNVLEIGERPALVKARTDAFNFYQGQLEQYKNVMNAATLTDLEDLAQDPHLVDKNNTFAAEQQVMLNGLKQSILSYLHPTVWREMQRQHQSLNKTKRLFAAVPAALTWV
ncbi:hypothetical protein [Hymenobacter lucidus]|uniref:TIGR02646 family protein n=1 Tax=Hymenobacter lucidus TaxID=2880930 RepID=A0ABS8AQW8_9BACT|nr:hypothetical protein [Hymenobacter lucidus]MCB2408615.1 hypothetical protein [Hymenobacter lucidus]